MKKILALVALLISIQSFSADVAPVVQSSFNKDFMEATEVRWHHYGDYIQASFLLGGQYITTHYTVDGELVKTERNISSSQLPLKLFVELKKTFSNSWITGLIEVVSGKHHGYSICLENADEQITLKSAGDKGWRIVRRILKV